MEERTVSFLRDLPFFKGLPAAGVEALVAVSSVKDYSKHSSLISQGMPASRFFVILSGWVKLYRTTREGEEAVVAVLTRGDVFGESAIFDGSIYPFSAEAAENSHILEIPAGKLKAAALASRALTSRLMAILADDVTRLQREREHVAMMTAPQRVGCLLLKLSADMIGNGGTFTFSYDKSLAAAQLAMKPETFSRALSQLKIIGVTVHGSEVQIEDFRKLAEHCCGHCSLEEGDCKGRRLSPAEKKRSGQKIKPGKLIIAREFPPVLSAAIFHSSSSNLY